MTEKEETIRPTNDGTINHPMPRTLGTKIAELESDEAWDKLERKVQSAEKHIGHTAAKTAMQLQGLKTNQATIEAPSARFAAAIEASRRAKKLKESEETLTKLKAPTNEPVQIPVEVRNGVWDEIDNYNKTTTTRQHAPGEAPITTTTTAASIGEIPTTATNPIKPDVTEVNHPTIDLTNN